MLIIQRPTVEAVDEEQNNRQRFAIGPLDPGFGTTLGNSLRRTLLSSIPGGAVTQLRFDEALHEFTTLPGVKEDVTDIILNLKDLLVRMHTDEPVTLRLDVRGPADATAGDLQTTADVEVLNPDLHIASINAKGRLAVDVTVERGRGYVSADRNKRSSTIGVIPIDSIFSPGAPGDLRHRAGPGGAVHQLRPPGARHRDRRHHHPPRGAGLGRRHPAQPGRPGGRPRGRAAGPGAGRHRHGHAAARPTWTCASRSSTSPSAPATASSGRRSTPSASWSSAPWTTCWPSPTSGRSRPTRWCSGWTSAGCRSAPGTERPCREHPKRGRRMGGDAAHQKAMLGNLVASLIAAESLVTTEAKAKALRPVAEKCVTAARKGGVHQHRRVVALIRDKDMAHKLFDGDRAALRRAPGWLHPDLQAGPPPGRQRADGADRVRLSGRRRSAVRRRCPGSVGGSWSPTTAPPSGGSPTSPRCPPWPARCARPWVAPPACPSPRR